MNLFSFGQLRIRLILLVLIAVVPFASLLFYAASEQKRRSMAAIEQNVLTMAESAAQAEALMLDGSREMLAGLELSLSEKTISTYRARILEKMNMKSNAELTHYGIKHNLAD